MTKPISGLPVSGVPLPYVCVNQNLAMDIRRKKELLQKACSELKSEFIGIDGIIDQIINAVEPWYCFPHIQERPAIVNLWGMTGTGKTDLVERLAKKLGVFDRYYRFEGSQLRDTYVLRDCLEDLLENAPGTPMIISLDEFQHARSRKSHPMEDESQISGKFWDLLDSGRLEAPVLWSQIGHFQEKLRFVKECLLLGVQVSEGKVTHKKKTFQQLRSNLHISAGRFEMEESMDLLSFSDLENIQSALNDRWSGMIEFLRYYRQLDLNEIADLLLAALRRMRRPKTLDASKSLIFVIGNLDEAYEMSQDLDPDQNADRFHENARKINILKIKKALLSRFRNEHIARLGNTHLIYPALSSQNYKDIIDLYLHKAGNKLEAEIGIPSVFDDSLKKHIYKDGVYPAQGVRPLVSTIRNLIESKFAAIYLHLHEKVKSCQQLNWVHLDHELIIKNDEDEIICRFAATSALDEIRENRDKEKQAIIAVHESGHAVASVFLLGEVPQKMVSVSVMQSGFGYVVSEIDLEVTSKSRLIKYLAFLLAGQTAEKLVFGPDGVTLGSESDIERATSFATQAIYHSGFGNMPVSMYREGHEANSAVMIDADAEDKVKSLIAEARNLAEKTLEENYEELIRLSEYLKDHPSVDRDGIIALLEGKEKALNKKEPSYRAMLDQVCLQYNQNLDTFCAL